MEEFSPFKYNLVWDIVTIPRIVRKVIIKAKCQESTKIVLKHLTWFKGSKKRQREKESGREREMQAR